VPLKASLKAVGLTLDLDTANREVLRWLNEVADRRVHGTTGVEPYLRLTEDRAYLQPLPRGPERQARDHERRPRTALPIESLQHPLSCMSRCSRWRHEPAARAHRAALRAVKLPAIHAEWPAYAQRAAQEERSFRDFLESVLSAERAARTSAFARRCSSLPRCRP